MAKRFSILAVAFLAAAVAFAADPEYTFREGVRVATINSILGVDASAAGNLAVATNLTVGGVATVEGTIEGHGTVRSYRSGGAGQFHAKGSTNQNAELLLWANTGAGSVDQWAIINHASSDNLLFLSGTNPRVSIAPSGAVGISNNLTVGGYIHAVGGLAVSGNASFAGAPEFASIAAPGTVVAAALTNLPTGTATNAAFFVVTYDGDTYAVPMYQIP